MGEGRGSLRIVVISCVAAIGGAIFFVARLVRETKGLELEQMDDGSQLGGSAEAAPAT